MSYNAFLVNDYQHDKFTCPSGKTLNVKQVSPYIIKVQLASECTADTRNIVHSDTAKFLDLHPDACMVTIVLNRDTTPVMVSELQYDERCSTDDKKFFSELSGKLIFE